MTTNASSQVKPSQVKPARSTKKDHIEIEGESYNKRACVRRGIGGVFVVWLRCGGEAIPAEFFAAKADAQFLCDQLACIPDGNRAQIDGKYAHDLTERNKAK